jgi:hypothetical protein
MNRIVLRDLPESHELDHQALMAITGAGLWGSIKKYSRKVGRYVKKTVQRKYNNYKHAYYLARSLPRTFYRTFF